MTVGDIHAHTHDSASDPATSPLHLPHAAYECPKCFTELQRDRDWWRARPAGSKLVGLVINRDDMPSVVEQRNELTRFGVPIEGFRHPAPETMESWESRLGRMFGRLDRGDVLVVASTSPRSRRPNMRPRRDSQLSMVSGASTAVMCSLSRACTHSVAASTKKLALWPSSAAAVSS